MALAINKVATGPIEPINAARPEPISRMLADSMNTGNTVETTAIMALS